MVISQTVGCFYRNAFLAVNYPSARDFYSIHGKLFPNYCIGNAVCPLLMDADELSPFRHGEASFSLQQIDLRPF
jgi:hypothetical protein